MSVNNSSYQQLIHKLDLFIRKYYFNKLIKGGLYSIGLILGLFLFFNTLEYYFYFGMGVRKLFYYSFILSSIVGIGVWIIDPLIRYFKLGKTITHEDASLIIGDHFVDVKDKLLNILQLKKQADSAENNSLIEASIQQKTNAISLVPFKAAIDLQKNRKYIKYALPPFLLLIFILFAAPSIIKDGTNRIINNGKFFAKAAPFSYLVDQSDLKVVQFQNHTLTVDVEGSVLPNEVFVLIDDFQYPMTKESKTSFSYTFKNVQQDINFQLSAGTVISDIYTLTVLKKPNLVDLTIEAAYPAYLNKKSEIFQSTGDVIVPEGTKLTWIIGAEETDKVRFSFSSLLFDAEERNAKSFKYSKKAMIDENYKLYLSNKNVNTPDSLLYNITVIKDQYPTISVQKIVDSLDNSLVYFIGDAIDDYGLRSLTFNYTIIQSDGIAKPQVITKLDKKDGKAIQFDQVFDIKKANIQPGEKIQFYFEVFDNDGVNGSKSTKSAVMSYEKPSIEEIKKIDESNDEQIKQELNKALKNIDKLQENMNKLKNKLLQSKQLNWQDKKEMEKLLDEQTKLQEQIEKAKQKLDENMKNQEEYKTQPEEIQEKQEKLQELFEQALDPEQKELMEKIKELLQELEKEDAVQMLDQFEKNNETLEKEMDRMLQLYKQLEMEKNVKDQIKELEKLAEKQEKLAEETEKGEKPKEELSKEQKELEKKLEELKKKQEELEEKNKELSPPKDMGDDNQEKMDDAQQDMQDSQSKLDKNDKSGASKSQKKAAKKMKDQAQSMSESMEGSASDQAGEDIETLRQLLENLVKLSFDQERLYKDITPQSLNSPSYLASMREQFKLQGDFSVIEDTLIALSNRNADIESFVMDKVSEIKYNMKESITELEERRIPDGHDKQRRTMKNINDLALMLNESLEKAQQAQASGMPGSQMCNKPGGKGSGKSGKVPMNKITEGQQGVNESLKKMKEAMDKAGKEGKGGKGGKEGSAKDFAEAAARQAAMRKALQEIQKEKQEQGKGSKEIDDIINNMDKIETELVNRRLNSETLLRMKDIETRLLEAEKAERQRELDNKRLAEAGEEKRREVPPSIQEYLKKRQAEIDMYKTVSPALRPYYKSLVNEYYKSLKTN